MSRTRNPVQEVGVGEGRMRKFWKTEGFWPRMRGEVLRGQRGRARRSRDMRLGELGFVWERCEDEEETGSREGARIIRWVRTSLSLGQGLRSIWPFLGGLV